MSREAGIDYLFFETDFKAELTRLIEKYETITGISVHPASFHRLLISWFADAVTQQNVRINYSGNQNIPSRAEGENLLALAELFFQIEKPMAKPAYTTIRFTISEPQDYAILVPGGTRISTTGGSASFNTIIVFSTVADAYVPIGKTYVDVEAKCQVDGRIGNGFVPGQISSLVDLYDYYESAVNITMSDGGADEATDDEFYELMRLSQDARSTAGPVGAYIYFAKKVSNEIGDVAAIQPSMVVKKTIPVYAGHAFFGGDTLIKETLTVHPHGSAKTAILGIDYMVDYTDGLLTIEIIAGGVLSGSTQLEIEIYNVLAGFVYIYVLMDDGTIASQTIKDKVYESCSAAEVRPLTDFVFVKDPNIVEYDIDFTYWIPTNSRQSTAYIEAAVDRAVDNYISWQCEKLGRDINPTELNKLVRLAGAKRLEIIKPVFAPLIDGVLDKGVPEVARLRSKKVTPGGFENE